MRVFIKILESILAISFGLLFAALLIPFSIIGLLFCVPISLVEDIWTFQDDR